MYEPSKLWLLNKESHETNWSTFTLTNPSTLIHLSKSNSLPSSQEIWPIPWNLKTALFRWDFWMTSHDWLAPNGPNKACFVGTKHRWLSPSSQYFDSCIQFVPKCPATTSTIEWLREFLNLPNLHLKSNFHKNFRNWQIKAKYLNGYQIYIKMEWIKWKWMINRWLSKFLTAK